MRNEKDFLDAIEKMAREAARKDALERRAKEAARKREDELAQAEAKRQEEVAAQKELEAELLSTASQMLSEVLEALEEASASEDEMNCEECPHKDECDNYNEEDYYEEDDLYEPNGCDYEEEEMQPRAHMFRSPLPFLMPGQVPAGMMVAGPFPENEEEAKELQRLIRKGALAEAKEQENPEDPIVSIISNYRKLNSKEKAQILSVLRTFM